MAKAGPGAEMSWFEGPPRGGYRPWRRSGSPRRWKATARRFQASAQSGSMVMIRSNKFDGEGMIVLAPGLAGACHQQIRRIRARTQPLPVDQGARRRVIRWHPPPQPGARTKPSRCSSVRAGCRSAISSPDGQCFTHPECERLRGGGRIRRRSPRAEREWPGLAPSRPARASQPQRR